MERKRAEDFDQDLLILFDAYVHGDIDRRGFLDKAARFAVGGVTAGMLLDMLSPKFAEAQQVPKDDKRLKAEYAEYEARIAISSLAVISGKLPPRAIGLVAEWTALHQQELTALWEKARRSEPLERLDPLP